jgi:hypothetical protein
MKSQAGQGFSPIGQALFLTAIVRKLLGIFWLLMDVGHTFCQDHAKRPFKIGHGIGSICALGRRDVHQSRQKPSWIRSRRAE